MCTKDPLTLMAMWGSMKTYDPDQNTAFEGPEKRLEVIIRFLPETHPGGFHSLSDEMLDTIVGALSAKIVSQDGNDFIKSFVLTESSLFVMKKRLIFITCGTTTLLNGLPRILHAISAIRAELEWVSFMHKNYSFPWGQRSPHSSLADEFSTLKKFFPTGKPYIFGPVDSDHYFLFCYDDIIRPCSSEDDTQLNMTMYGLDKNQTKYWFSDRTIVSNAETAALRATTRLDTVADDQWKIQDMQFDPCGYSLNALRDDEYQTIHITPEEDCSFASYETNCRDSNYSDRIKRVLGVFNPQRFSVFIFFDPECTIGKLYKNGDTIGVEKGYFPEYQMQNCTVNEFVPGYLAMKINYVKKTSTEVGDGKNIDSALPKVENNLEVLH